ncbi:hypothetical protein Ciccas_010835 [Cichlidogyrus casuarinus]|uniref:Uncharacterized protein n=1 Tax=Cichlidogyrus casuarinus TaxID=1844966 RepID=A0ABD2PUM6_9PLAT
MGKAKIELGRLDQETRELDRQEEEINDLEKKLEMRQPMMVSVDLSKEIAEAEQELTEYKKKYEIMSEYIEIIKPLEDSLQHRIIRAFSFQSKEDVARIQMETDQLDIKKMEVIRELSQNMRIEPNTVELEELKIEIQTLNKEKELKMDALVIIINGLNSVAKWALICKALYMNYKSVARKDLNVTNPVITEAIRKMSIMKQMELIKVRI